MHKSLTKIKRHLQNIPGKSVKKKYVVFESDDWGSERIPSKEAIVYLKSHGIHMERNPFNLLDSLESTDDLTALFTTLTKFRDNQGNHPVITANSVTANPYYKKILESGYKEYHFESVLQTYQGRKECFDSFKIINEGIASGVYHPQFHGREHLNVRQWLATLQSGNKNLLHSFNAGVYGIDLDIESNRRNNFMAAFDSFSAEDDYEHSTIIKQGLESFFKLYGFSPKSFIAPCYVWNSYLEETLSKNGIYYLQGLQFQFSPDNKKTDYRKIYHYAGQSNKYGQVYLVRNCFFEPSLNPGTDWTRECLSRIKIAFNRKKPAIVGIHRLNFIGSLNEKNRTENLRKFSELLELIIKTWPDVEFTTSDRLGEIIQ